MIALQESCTNNSPESGAFRKKDEVVPSELLASILRVELLRPPCYVADRSPSTQKLAGVPPRYPLRGIQAPVAESVRPVIDSSDNVSAARFELVGS